jgi:broad specificity phosphatase PhoE
LQSADQVALGTLFLIRHGHTRGNGKHYVGREDLELDGIGHAQAEQLRQAFASEHLDAIYCSPLARARQTAESLIRFGRHERRQLRLEERPDLMEIDYGELQGCSKAEHSLRLRQQYATERMPGGESLADVHARGGRIAVELAQRLRRGESVVVVAHYRSLQMLRAAIVGESLAAALARRDYKPGNGSVLRMQFLAGNGPVGVTRPTRLELVSTTYSASRVTGHSCAATQSDSAGEVRA